MDKKRRNYIGAIDSETVDSLLRLACDIELEVVVYSGCLLDNYVIYDTDCVNIGNIKPRKNIIIKEVYLNEWSSCYEMTMTNDDDLVSNYVSEMEAELEELELEYEYS